MTDFHFGILISAKICKNSFPNEFFSERLFKIGGHKYIHYYWHKNWKFQFLCRRNVRKKTFFLQCNLLSNANYIMLISKKTTRLIWILVSTEAYLWGCQLQITPVKKIEEFSLQKMWWGPVEPLGHLSVKRKFVGVISGMFYPKLNLKKCIKNSATQGENFQERIYSQKDLCHKFKAKCILVKENVKYIKWKIIHRFSQKIFAGTWTDSCIRYNSCLPPARKEGHGYPMVLLQPLLKFPCSGVHAGKILEMCIPNSFYSNVVCSSKVSWNLEILILRYMKQNWFFSFCLCNP